MLRAPLNTSSGGGPAAPGTPSLTREGLQGNVEQVLGATLRPQDPIVADRAGTEHEAAGVYLGRVVGDVGKDVKVTAHVHALAYSNSHGHPCLLFINQLVQVVGPREGFPLLQGTCVGREESFITAGIGISEKEAGAGFF